MRASVTSGHPDQLVEVLGEDDGRQAADVFGVTDAGTFGKHPCFGCPRANIRYPIPAADFTEWFTSARQTARHQGMNAHNPPGDKVVAAWNGFGDRVTSAGR